MTAKEIQHAICVSETNKRNLACENVKYVFSDWENDVLTLNRGGMVTEFEVKVSRSDFLADRKKRKFQLLDKKQAMEWSMPNRFYYACPPNLIKESELPWFAGLVYVSDSVEIIRKAPLMNKYKHAREKLLEKFCRVMQERKYLGGCMLTIKNAEAAQRRNANTTEYEVRL